MAKTYAVLRAKMKLASRKRAEKRAKAMLANIVARLPKGEFRLDHLGD